MPRETVVELEFGHARAAEALTLRDWFAGKALTCIDSLLSPAEVSLRAYRIADAMLRERLK